MSVDRERDVDDRNEDSEQVTNDDDAIVVFLRDAQAWSRNSLCPAQAHVDSKDDHRHDIEKAPIPVLEDLVLELVNVTHWDWSH